MKYYYVKSSFGFQSSGVDVGYEVIDFVLFGFILESVVGINVLVQ